MGYTPRLERTKVLSCLALGNIPYRDQTSVTRFPSWYNLCMDNQKLDFDATWDQVSLVVKQALLKLTDKNRQDMQSLFNDTLKSTEVSPEDQKIAKDYLMEAFIDIRSYKLLYGERIYPRAIHFLQQAVEKAAKAWALGFGLLGREEVRRSSHRTPMVFLRILRTKTMERLLPLIKEIAPGMHTDISSAWQILSKGSHPDTAKMTKARIDDYLSSIDSLDRIENSIDSMMASLVKPLGHRTMGFSVGQHVNVGMSLLTLGMITFPHAFSTRYPDGKVADGELLPRDYNSKLGIVKSAPKIEKCLVSKMTLLSNLLDERKAKN
ncbi:hypothetical protein ES703_69228 [subsurface metagenome]